MKPTPSTPTPVPAPAGPLVIKSTTLRDALIAGTCIVLLLVALFFGMGQLGSKPAGNTLTGTILSKNFIPAPEEQVTFGRKGLTARRVDGEYLFTVRVKSLDRTFEVQADRRTFESKEVGDNLTFLRPPSEQR